MNELEAAYKILEVLKGNKQIITIRELAKSSGFKSVADVDFKKGFNLLQRKKAVKLHQSGWPSEHRGVNNHPKTVLLVADVYELKNAEQELTTELKLDMEDEVTKPCDLWSELAPIVTMFGDSSFINKEDYNEGIKSVKNLNFWEPKRPINR